MKLDVTGLNYELKEIVDMACTLDEINKIEEILIKHIKNVCEDVREEIKNK